MGLPTKTRVLNPCGGGTKDGVVTQRAPRDPSRGQRTRSYLNGLLS
jgi:hypothetical protein